MLGYICTRATLTNGQIDWNRIYDANVNAAASDLPAAYVLYEDRSDDSQLTLTLPLNLCLMRLV